MSIEHESDPNPGEPRAAGRPRIEPVGPEVAVTSNMEATFLRHPDLHAAFRPFGTYLRQGRLPARERELAILRTAWNCRCAYEWGAHVDGARESGLDERARRRVLTGPDAPEWSELDRAILRAADELHSAARIGDAAWDVLAARFAAEELIELAVLVGNYHLIAFVANSAGVHAEPHLEPFPE